MASLGHRVSEFSAERDRNLTPGVGPTRAAYIHRIAVARIITGGRDPKHETRPFKFVSADGKEVTEGKSPCLCRFCRAWICIRQTPADEIAEAKTYADSLKATGQYIDDTIFG